MMEKKPFRKYSDNDNKKPIPIKLNEQDELMLKIGMYALNIHSKGGVMKRLAHTGLKVLLADFGMDELHYLTRSDRVKVIQERPPIEQYSGKGNPKSG